MSTLKKILFLLILTCSLSAKDLTPLFSVEASGGVTDLVYANDKLYAATKASKVEIFNPKNQKLIQTINLPKIKDFMGDVIDAKIYSIDVLDDTILILAQGDKGGRGIYVFENSELKEIIPAEKRMFIAYAKFISKDKILFSLLSNELYLYDLQTRTTLYRKQISQSRFSNFALNKNKTEVIIADESGDLKQIDLHTFELIHTYAKQNLDNVFQIDWKENIILTAGQDRRSVVYNTRFNSAYYKQVDFLIYSCGLSPSGKIGAFSNDEQNNILVFNTSNKKELYKLTENKMTLTKILFINENELFVSSDDKKINYYKLQ